jgi:NAD(P)-dependent dehydrogenase (short-subunit alcohol dehydrogenase family)
MKKIIVTGSSSGFGLLTVQKLAQNGHTVYATMRNVQTKNAKQARDLRQWAIASSVDVRIVELDVTSDESVSQAITKIIAEAKQIDVLINNAGMMTLGLSESLSTKQLEQIFQVNVFGVHRMNNAVLPYMRLQQNGLIIQISSSLSRLHLPWLGVYSATKAAVDTLSETLHYELSKAGIDCVIIQPGVYPSTNLYSNINHAGEPLSPLKYNESVSEIEQSIHRLFTHTSESDPREVAEIITKIIDTPPGKRKLWTQVGIKLGEVYVDFINESIYLYSQRMQSLLGISSININQKV